MSTEAEYQKRIEQLERELADARAELALWRAAQKNGRTFQRVRALVETLGITSYRLEQERLALGVLQDNLAPTIAYLYQVGGE